MKSKLQISICALEFVEVTISVKKTIDILLFMLTMGFYGPKIDMLSILPS
jgi:hypothetical protein